MGIAKIEQSLFTKYLDVLRRCKADECLFAELKALFKILDTEDKMTNFLSFIDNIKVDSGDLASSVGRNEYFFKTKDQEKLSKDVKYIMSIPIASLSSKDGFLRTPVYTMSADMVRVLYNHKKLNKDHLNCSDYFGITPLMAAVLELLVKTSTPGSFENTYKKIDELISLGVNAKKKYTIDNKVDSINKIILDVLDRKIMNSELSKIDMYTILASNINISTLLAKSWIKSRMEMVLGTSIIDAQEKGLALRQKKLLNDDFKEAPTKSKNKSGNKNLKI